MYGIHLVLDIFEKYMDGQNFEILDCSKYNGYWKIQAGTQRGIEEYKVFIDRVELLHS